VKGKVLITVYWMFILKLEEVNGMKLTNESSNRKWLLLYAHYIQVWDLKSLLIRENEKSFPVNMQSICVKQ